MQQLPDLLIGHSGLLRRQLVGQLLRVRLGLTRGGDGRRHAAISIVQQIGPGKGGQALGGQFVDNPGVIREKVRGAKRRPIQGDLLACVYAQCFVLQCKHQVQLDGGKCRVRKVRVNSFRHLRNGVIHQLYKVIPVAFIH